jgi:DNA-directed RNA polymerase specialized sigma24 family protein
VIESALRSSVEFRSVEHLTGWAVTRARWLALDSIRLRRRETAWLRSFWERRRPTPDRSSPSAELIELIERLPPAQKTALMLTLSGASDRRIAIMMGEQESTVRSLRRHARERLAREIWGA